MCDGGIICNVDRDHPSGPSLLISMLCLNFMEGFPFLNAITAQPLFKKLLLTLSMTLLWWQTMPVPSSRNRRNPRNTNRTFRSSLARLLELSQLLVS